MKVMPLIEGETEGGIDTHQDLHVAAIIDHRGATLGVEQFPATRRGYRELIAWMTNYRSLVRIELECTGSYGAGLARILANDAVPVFEVTAPDKGLRRAKGKDDFIDAVAAARSAYSGQRLQAAKDRRGQVEALRVLRKTRKTAVKCRRATLQQIHNTIVGGPDQVREQFGSMTRMALIRSAAASRPDTYRFRDPVVATRLSLKSVARRVLELNDEIAQLDEFITKLVQELAPTLLALQGVGVDVAAQLLVTAGDNPERLDSGSSFAMLCGACPVPASSGKVTRYRLNRGGNRQANAALHAVVLVRMYHDERTKAYVKRRVAEGLFKREIIRYL
jgi:hypothetical protein